MAGFSQEILKLPPSLVRVAKVETEKGSLYTQVVHLTRNIFEQKADIRDREDEHHMIVSSAETPPSRSNKWRYL